MILMLILFIRSNRPEVSSDPRLSQSVANNKSLLSSLPPGLPLGFPPFLFPPTSLQEAMKDSSHPVTSPFQFLPGFRPPAPGAAPGFPPGILPPGLLDPNHAQALLSMMRGQLPNTSHPSIRARTNPPLDLTSGDTESPAKKLKRDSSSVDEEAPVSPPPSSPTSIPHQSLTNSCKSVSLCLLSQSCSDEGKKMISWSVDQVVEFVRTFDEVSEHADVFAREKIDGSTLVLLTDTHLTSMGIKLGPAIKFRCVVTTEIFIIKI